MAGKIFNLDTPKPKCVEFFVRQHICSALHLKNSSAEKKTSRLLDPGADAAAEGQDGQLNAPSMSECHGVCVTDPSCWASVYSEEWAMWCKMTNVGNNFNLHTYDWCLSTGELRVTSRSCEKQFAQDGGHTCCPECRNDDLVKGALRNVVRCAKITNISIVHATSYSPIR